MLTVVAGLKRSGTTWLYNVARIAYQHAGIAVAAGGDELYRSWDHHTPLLVKTHWWHERLATDATSILTSDRDVEDAYRSLARLFGRTPSGAEMAKIVEHARRWDAVATWRMTYTDLERPSETAKGIVAALDLDVDPARVLADVDSLQPPESGQDPVTLLFASHRSPA